MISSQEWQGRFLIKKQLGQGSFSTIYSAFDKIRKETVALKVEKADKSKKVLMFEYQVLKSLQGLPNICPVYEFVESDQPKGLNFIVMKLMGKNLATLKKQKGKEFTPTFAIRILLQMLDSIEKLHDKGYIHRDIKPSNFVMGKGRTRNQVFMVDFGLGKLHLDRNGTPLAQRATADFRGTVTYASLNAHNKIDLSRRDDMWSLYFVIMDFLNEQLPWRSCRDNKADDVRDVKTRCLADPGKYLWCTTTSWMTEVQNIFYSIRRLEYADRPDYTYIRSQLLNLLQREEAKEVSLRSLDSRTASTKKRKGLSEEDEPEEPQRKLVSGAVPVPPVPYLSYCRYLSGLPQPPQLLNPWVPYIPEPYKSLMMKPTPPFRVIKAEQPNSAKRDNDLAPPKEEALFRVDVDCGYYSKLYAQNQ